MNKSDSVPVRLYLSRDPKAGSPGCYLWVPTGTMQDYREGRPHGEERVTRMRLTDFFDIESFNPENIEGGYVASLGLDKEGNFEVKTLAEYNGVSPEEVEEFNRRYGDRLRLMGVKYDREVEEMNERMPSPAGCQGAALGHSSHG